MAIGNIQAFNSTPITASTLIQTGQGVLGGVFISSGTAVTVKVWDSLTATGKVIAETTTGYTTAATVPPVFLKIPAAFSIGCFVTIGGTGAVTVLWL